MSKTPSFPEQFNLADYFLFDRLNDGAAERAAILYGDRSYSYGEVAERSRSLARALLDAGLRSEERVYIVLPDCPPFAWSLFATFAAGGVVAMGNPHAPREDLQYVVGYTRARVLITTETVARDLADFLRTEAEAGRGPSLVLVVPDGETGADHEIEAQLPNVASDFCEFRSLHEFVESGNSSEARLPQTHRDDACMWLFTSGSTGRPKAARHCHRDFAFNTEVYAKATVGYRKDDVSISVPRLFFGYATGTNLFFPFAVGATVGLFAERPTPESLSLAAERYRPTIITNVPTMMGKLLDHDAQLREAGGKGIDFSTVRFQLSAGEALPPALYERFAERFGPEVYDGIGSAEMFHIYASNRPGDIKLGALGKAVEGYELRVLPRDATGPGAEPVAPGEIGVLWVRGDSVATEYVQDRDRSWKTFHGHWCRTGDLFTMDEEGYLWFAGRDDDLFKVSGVWVSPIEVETCLTRHPAVSQAAVIKSEKDGLQHPKAFVVLRAGVTEGEDSLRSSLQEHVKSCLSKHKYPREVVFLKEMPKNDRGKIDKKALAQGQGS